MTTIKDENCDRLLFNNLYTDYVNKLNSLLQNIDKNKLYAIIKLIRKSKRIWIIGNGGSHSVAEHAAVDLLKFCNKHAFSISNGAMMTMTANDYGYEHGYSWVLDKLAVKNSDLIIGISTSGKSQNILRALICKRSAKTIFICGNGNPTFANNVDVCLTIESIHAQTLEDIFSLLFHIISMTVTLKGKNAK